MNNEDTREHTPREYIIQFIKTKGNKIVIRGTNFSFESSSIRIRINSKSIGQGINYIKTLHCHYDITLLKLSQVLVRIFDVFVVYF